MYRPQNRIKTFLQEIMTRKIDPRFILYRTKWNLYPKLDIISQYPLHIDIETSSRCNLACSMCKHRISKFKKNDIDPDIINNLLLRYGSKIYSIKFNWRGEPTLNKQLCFYIKMAKYHNVLETQINTNGLLIDNILANRLIDSGLDRIIFSVDGMRSETYESIRQGGDFNLLLKNIYNLINIKHKRKLKKPFIRVQMCYKEELKEEAELFKLHWSNLPVQVSLIDSQERIKKSVSEVIEKKNFCEQPWQRLTISYEGNVYPCCADWEENFCLGNVKQTSLYDIWHGDKISRLRKIIKEGKPNESNICKQCPRLRRDNG